MQFKLLVAKAMPVIILIRSPDGISEAAERPLPVQCIQKRLTIRLDGASHGEALHEAVRLIAAQHRNLFVALGLSFHLLSELFVVVRHVVSVFASELNDLSGLEIEKHVERKFSRPVELKSQFVHVDREFLHARGSNSVNPRPSPEGEREKSPSFRLPGVLSS